MDATAVTPLSYSISELCERVGISRTTFYQLDGIGLGPRKFYPGRRPRVTHEAALEWLRELERRGPEARGALKAARRERV